MTLVAPGSLPRSRRGPTAPVQCGRYKVTRRVPRRGGGRRPEAYFRSSLTGWITTTTRRINANVDGDRRSRHCSPTSTHDPGRPGTIQQPASFRLISVLEWTRRTGTASTCIHLASNIHPNRPKWLILLPPTCPQHTKMYEEVSNSSMIKINGGRRWPDSQQRVSDNPGVVIHVLDRD